jgi:hypothetical protein
MPDKLFQFDPVEDLGDLAHSGISVEVIAIRCDNSGALLTAMLQGVETEIGEICGLLAAVNSVDTALLFGD